MKYLSDKTIKDIKKRTHLVTHPSGRKERVFFKSYPDMMDEHNHYRYKIDKEFTSNLREIQLKQWGALCNPTYLTKIKHGLRWLYAHLRV